MRDPPPPAGGMTVIVVGADVSVPVGVGDREAHLVAAGIRIGAQSSSRAPRYSPRRSSGSPNPRRRSGSRRYEPVPSKATGRGAVPLAGVAVKLATGGIADGDVGGPCPGVRPIRIRDGQRDGERPGGSVLMHRVRLRRLRRCRAVAERPGRRESAALRRGAVERDGLADRASRSGCPVISVIGGTGPVPDVTTSCGGLAATSRVAKTAESCRHS